MSFSTFNNPTLVIGSPSTAENGEYQRVVSSMDRIATQTEMFDRLLERGQFKTVAELPNVF
jgi:hypothetical protein